MVGGPAHRWMIGILTPVIKARALSPFVSQKFVVFIARSSKEDLIVIHDLMKTAKVTPVIDKRFSLSEVPQAMRYLEQRHARGKVVITLAHN